MQFLDTVLNFFAPKVQAATTVTTTAQTQQGGGLSMMVMVGIFIFFMYFAMWRPQSKRAKEHRNLLTSLAKGDEVVTTGGLLGKIAKITDNYVVLSLTDNVDITVQKSSIAGALPKGTLKAI